MKKTLLMVLVLALVCNVACFGKKEPVPQPKIEPVIEERAWEIFNEYPMTLAESRAKGLVVSEVALDKPRPAFNCVDAKRNRWEDTILPIGTWIALGKEGIPIYKVDCGNKLFIPVTLKPISAIATPLKGRRIWAGLWNFLEDVFRLLMFALGILLALAILALALWALWNLIRWLLEQTDNRLNRNVTTNPVTTPSTVPVAPVAPAPVATLAPVLAPVPAPVPTPTPSTTVWTIKTSLDKNGKTNIEGEGLKSLSIKISGKEILIKASRR